MQAVWLRDGKVVSGTKEVNNIWWNLVNCWKLLKLFLPQRSR